MFVFNIVAILIFSRVAFWVNPSSDDDRKLVRTKPRRFGDVCGGARSRREKSQLKSRPGVVGEKKSKNFLARVSQREKNLIF